MADSLIKTTALARRYQMGKTFVDALRGVDFDVAPGEFVSLVGPSGSGKSTLLHLIGGLVRPTGGEVWVNGLELGRSSDEQLVAYRRDTLGFIFQSFNLLPIKAAWENVAVPLMLAGTPLARRKERALELLDQLGLGQRSDHRPSELSGGEQQRVAIARAIAKRPDVLLCDEPTGALDAKTGVIVLESLERVHRELGSTTAVITHNAAIAAMADRVLVMSSGGIASDTRNARRAAPRDLSW